MVPDTEHLSEVAEERLRIIMDMDYLGAGFQVAMEDLRLRGPGDFFGERQHGLPKLKIADMLNDMQILQEAQQCAKELTERDPELSSPALRGLRAEMRRLFASNNGTVTL